MRKETVSNHDCESSGSSGGERGEVVARLVARFGMVLYHRVEQALEVHRAAVNSEDRRLCLSVLCPLIRKISRPTRLSPVPLRDRLLSGGATRAVEKLESILTCAAA